MRIAIIGGRYKNEGQLSRVARKRGYDLEYHEGHTNGRNVEAMRTTVSRAELVVIITDCNSHGAVHVAKRAARLLDRPTLIINNFGVARLSRLLDALDLRRLSSREELRLASGAC